MIPVLGPFPCGAARCECTKGGCDHLGVCPPEMRQGGEPPPVTEDDTWWAEVDALAAEYRKNGVPRKRKP